MGTIYIVGLGPGRMDLIPVRNLSLLRQTGWCFVRTERHPAVRDLEAEGIRCRSLDYLYDQRETFEEVYQELARIILQAAEQGEVIYAVPGHPMVAEKSVQMILSSFNEHSLEILPAMSCLDAIYAALRLDPTGGIMICDCLELRKSVPVRSVPLVCTQLYDRVTASDVKLTLMDFYPEEHPVVVVKSAGVPGEELIKEVPLYKLDRLQWIDHLCSLFVPPFKDMQKDEDSSFLRLREIMRDLRGPRGCLWDKEQNSHSLKRYLIEETYEVIEAIEEEDMYKLQEELGDLLLQIVFHAQIAEEAGEFTIEDVIRGIVKKLVRRHPHVFGEGVNVACVSDVNLNWERIKNNEKKDRPRFDIPRGLPALLRAEKVQKKAAEVGFDWPNADGAWDKVREETDELSSAINNGELQEAAEETGDLLFAVVNVARFLEIDPEEALSSTISKFIKRFQYIEDSVSNSGQNPEDLDLGQLDALWNEAKQKGF